MNGHTIVGDGTAAQLAAMLTGVSERENPEARRGFPGIESLRKNLLLPYSLQISSPFNFRLEGGENWRERILNP